MSHDSWGQTARSQFESYVYNKLKSTKLCVSRTRGSCGDNGIDIFGPFKEHTLLVQCKNYTIIKVGINEIQEFEGALIRMDTPTPELLHASSSQYRENAVENMLETILRKLEKAEEDRRQEENKIYKKINRLDRWIKEQDRRIYNQNIICFF
ncbi:hypothetical protein RhiirA4_458887 [Rhizophagus irregularis]|uniref:Restriction endonuclease type IV Mrr domain-containing protein n=1 Tax=Rhizophagus irregularis TaxID=588596 RepID=A0A2I1GD49_9GLOM|nr:hypothetical protein RhiirA4_458887 [Rhizophagus irregularis]